jgi:hypothetical protein
MGEGLSPPLGLCFKKFQILREEEKLNQNQFSEKISRRKGVV